MLPDQDRLRGDELLRQGKVDAALAALRDALRADPSDDAAWDLAGRALAEKREWAEAFHNFERALRLSPGHATYLYDYGLGLARAGRYTEARARAEAAVAAAPTDARAKLLLANIVKALGAGK
jgi:Tfp pilus assembly protein PilF